MQQQMHQIASTMSISLSGSDGDLQTVLVTNSELSSTSHLYTCSKTLQDSKHSSNADFFFQKWDILTHFLGLLSM